MPASIPPRTSLWLCRGFWPRPTPGFAGDLYGGKAQLCTASPRDAFRTRRYHLWLFPSPAESTAPEHGDFGTARQQKPPGANAEGYEEGRCFTKRTVLPEQKNPLSDRNPIEQSRYQRQGYILPPGSNIKTSQESLADASPISFHPRSLQDRKPGCPYMTPSMARAAPNRPNLGKSPLLLPPRTPKTGFGFWTRLRRDWPEKSALKAKKEERD